MQNAQSACPMESAHPAVAVAHLRCVLIPELIRGKVGNVASPQTLGWDFRDGTSNLWDLFLSAAMRIEQ